MATSTLDRLQADDMAYSVARALAAANEAAVKHGVNIDESLVNISEESAPPSRVWRIHYGPRDYVNKRGGDFIVLVEDGSDAVKRTIRGQ